MAVAALALAQEAAPRAAPALTLTVRAPLAATPLPPDPPLPPPAPLPERASSLAPKAADEPAPTPFEPPWTASQSWEVASARFPAARLPRRDHGVPQVVEAPAPSHTASPGPPASTPAPASPARWATDGPPGPTRGPQAARPLQAPPYPPLARRRGWEGLVVLELCVDATGRVVSVSLTASSGRDLLDRAALDAARDWRFSPALSDGHPVPGRVDVPVRFTLD